MNTREYLLTCLAEECSEVTQVVAKALRFGMLDHHPKTGDQPNWLLLVRELHDVMAIVEMLEEGDHLKRVWDPLAIKAKKEKVTRYMERSKDLGTLDETPILL